MAAIATFAAAASANAAVIGNTNWADDVNAYTGNIQNYGGSLLGPSTVWWLTGPSDADVDGNGYAWDAADQDTVAGWRSTAPSEYVIVQWDSGIPDVAGDDLTIHLYGGPGASANVLASTDGISFNQIGTISSGTPGYFQDETFDFAGLFSGDVQYVKVERVTSGPQTGMFFDSFAGVVPEPATIGLMMLGVAAGLRPRRNS